MVKMDSLSSNVLNTISDRTGKDITGEVEVDASDVDICKIEELVPSSTPITIPYVEIYRTNELEFVPYFSPYNVGVSSDGSDSSSDSVSASDTDTINNDGSSDSSDSNSVASN